MAMFIFAKRILAGEPIQVFNHGNMKRDFTYIDDIVNGTRAALDKNYKYELFNLGNHKSVNLMDMIYLLEENLGKKAILDLQPMQLGDVPESMAEITKSQQMLRFGPRVEIETGIAQFVE